MNPQVERPVISRAQVLILAALGAALWIVVSLFGASSSASAAESIDPQHPLLGAVTDPVAALPVVSAVVEEPAADEPAAEPTVAAVAVPVAVAVAEVTTDPVGIALPTVQTTVTAVGQTLQPILDQPLVATTADLLTGSVDTAATAFRHGAVPAQGAETAEPAVAGLASADPAKQQVAIATGQDAPLSSPPLPPVSPDATPTSPTSAGHPLMAAIVGSSSDAAFAVATGFTENDVVPSSPTYDTDCSPD